MSACQMTSNVIAERCSRLKTRDWICSYCCNADRCNYYVPVSRAIGFYLAF
ncbi:high affinity cationic amino acid transporter 1 [Schistosoma japonicum]|nr:high affinity cationic amino acid transporter 1 [Schistosoma japonicum]